MQEPLLGLHHRTFAKPGRAVAFGGVAPMSIGTDPAESPLATFT
jgi:hypothetical protein